MSKITIIEGNANDKDNEKILFLKGEKGADGVSPSASISKEGNVATITVVDAEGTTAESVSDGISPIITTSKSDGVTTVSFVDAEGTKTATINDGETYEIPTNSVIGWSGTSSDIPGGYEEVDDFVTESEVETVVNTVAAGTTLYSDSTGTLGPVTLSDSAVNYDYMEIYFRTNEGTNYESSVKVYSPNNKNVPLTYILADSSTTIYQKYALATINGTSITLSNGREHYYNNGSTPVVTAGNYIYITRVVGYKY